MTKGLKEFKRLAYENACKNCQYFVKKDCPCSCVWLEIEKELKALEIIKEKDVLPSSIIFNKDYEAYMFDRTYQEGWTLTKEIFNFLKEVLEK